MMGADKVTHQVRNCGRDRRCSLQNRFRISARIRMVDIVARNPFQVGTNRMLRFGGMGLSRWNNNVRLR